MLSEKMYKTAVITGGSSGIGLAIAERLIQFGVRLLIAGISQEEVEAGREKLFQGNSKAEVYTFHGDLSLPETVDALWAVALDRLGSIGILVNNAGFGHYAYTPETDLEKEQRMIALNCNALHRLSVLASRHMVQRDEGHIINISSISAFQPAPMLNTYASTKAFVLQYTLGLHYEFKAKGSKVNATAICPTPVRTGFEAAAGLQSTGLYSSWMLVDTDTVVRAVIETLRKPVPYIVPGGWFHLLNKVSRRLPYGLSVWIVRATLREKSRV